MENRKKYKSKMKQEEEEEIGLKDGDQFPKRRQSFLHQIDQARIKQEQFDNDQQHRQQLQQQQQETADSNNVTKEQQQDEFSSSLNERTNKQQKQDVDGDDGGDLKQRHLRDDEDDEKNKVSDDTQQRHGGGGSSSSSSSSLNKLLQQQDSTTAANSNNEQQQTTISEAEEKQRRRQSSFLEQIDKARMKQQEFDNDNEEPSSSSNSSRKEKKEEESSILKQQQQQGKTYLKEAKKDCRASGPRHVTNENDYYDDNTNHHHLSNNVPSEKMKLQEEEVVSKQQEQQQQQEEGETFLRKDEKTDRRRSSGPRHVQDENDYYNNGDNKGRRVSGPRHVQDDNDYYQNDKKETEFKKMPSKAQEQEQIPSSAEALDSALSLDEADNEEEPNTSANVIDNDDINENSSNTNGNTNETVRQQQYPGAYSISADGSTTTNDDPPLYDSLIAPAPTSTTLLNEEEIDNNDLFVENQQVQQYDIRIPDAVRVSERESREQVEGDVPIAAEVVSDERTVQLAQIIPGVIPAPPPENREDEVQTRQAKNRRLYCIIGIVSVLIVIGIVVGIFLFLRESDSPAPTPISGPAVPVTVVFQLDSNPDETSWRLDCVNQVRNVPPGTYKSKPNQTIETIVSELLEGENCTFTMRDAGNNGIDDGYYRIYYDAKGSYLSSGGGFCNWGSDGTAATSTCEGGAQGGDWCNKNADRCESVTRGCSGRWCPGGTDTSKSAMLLAGGTGEFISETTAIFTVEAPPSPSAAPAVPAAPSNPPPSSAVVGSCGGGSVGNRVCQYGECCSEFGWCGTSPEHCGDDEPAPTNLTMSSPTNDTSL